MSGARSAKFQARATITYSLATNEIYAYSEVYDHITTWADTWQLLLDADHSSGDCYPSGTGDDDRWQASSCQHYESYNNTGPTEQGPGPVHFFWGAGLPHRPGSDEDTGPVSGATARSSRSRYEWHVPLGG